jgi:2'-5' RNA ligase
MADIRSFVAVPLPQELQQRVAAAAAELATVLDGVKWSRKTENLHITLKFLGPVEEGKLAALGEALGRTLAELPRFRIEVRRMGAFPSQRHANVVWADIDDLDGGLAATASVVDRVAAGFGLPPEHRPFTGHVTLGRSKGRGVDARAAFATFAAREFGGTVVDEVHVYESRLGGGPHNEGSTYVLRSRAKLGPPTFQQSQNPQTGSEPPAVRSDEQGSSSRDAN